MTPRNVELVNGQVPRKRTMTTSPDVEVEQKGGAQLAKEIVDDQLRKIHQSLKSTQEIDGNHVRTIKDLTQVLGDLCKIDREQRKDDTINDKLRSLTEEQLDLVISGKVKAL